MGTMGYRNSEAARHSAVARMVVPTSIGELLEKVMRLDGHGFRVGSQPRKPAKHETCGVALSQHGRGTAAIIAIGSG